MAYEKQGDVARSAALLEELVPLAERVFGPDHRETNRLATNLAFALDRLGRNDEALRLTRRIYESLRRTLGETHSDTINARNGLAAALYRQGDYAASAALLEQSRRDAIAEFGRRHMRSLDSGANLAQVLRRTGELDRAAAVADEVLSDARAFYQDQPTPELAWYAWIAGDIRHDQGHAVAGVPLLEEALALARRGPDRETERAILRSLALALSDAGRRDEAERTLQTCLELMRELGADEDALAATRTLLPGD